MFFVNFRDTIISLIHATKYGKLLMKRSMILEVGLSGRVSAFDKAFAESQKLKPLNKFERWLVAPHARQLRLIHQDAWKHAIKDVLGEDL